MPETIKHTQRPKSMSSVSSKKTVVQTTNIPPGYKFTKVGVIPEEWDVKLLESVSKRGSGHTPDKKIYKYYNGGIKWVSLADSSKLDSGLIHKTEIEISQEGIKNSSAVLHKKGTVLMSRDAGVGKSAIMAEDMAVSQHFITWTCDGLLTNWYLYYHLQFKKELFERMAVGSTIKTIGLSFFKKLQIPYPPLPEQQKIAAILGLWDQAIATTQSLIEQLKTRNKGLSQQLLTGMKRVSVDKNKSGFNDTWRHVSLNECADNVNLRNKGLHGTEKLFAVTKKSGIIPMREQVKGLSFDNCKLVSKNWFAYNPMRINIGSIALWGKDEEIMVSGDYVVFACDENKLLPNYLEHIRKTLPWENYMLIAGNGSVRVRIYFKDLGNFRFPLPDIKEQKVILNILEKAQQELKCYHVQLALLQTQKKGLMQKLLTGEVRVEVDK